MNIKGVSEIAKKCMLLSPQTSLGLQITGKYTYIACTVFHNIFQISEIICGAGQTSVYIG